MVIAIIGILVALLLPAVQAAREAARALQCRNNLKQLATAWHTFDSINGNYPGGGWLYSVSGDPDCGNGLKQPGGWIFRLLPHIEQQGLHDLGLGLTGGSEWTAKRQAHGERYVTAVPILNCPTRRRTETFFMASNGCCVPGNVILPPGPARQARTDYAANAGSGPPTALNVLGDMPAGLSIQCYNSPDPDGSEWGDAYQESGGVVTRDWNGVSYSGSQIQRAHIKDGTSNTYMAGEKNVDPNSYYGGPQDWGDDWGMFTGHQDDNYRICYKNPTNDFDSSRPTITPIIDTPGTGVGFIRYSVSFGSASPSSWVTGSSVEPSSLSVVAWSARAVRRETRPLPPVSSCTPASTRPVAKPDWKA